MGRISSGRNGRSEFQEEKSLCCLVARKTQSMKKCRVHIQCELMENVRAYYLAMP